MVGITSQQVDVYLHVFSNMKSVKMDKFFRRLCLDHRKATVLKLKKAIDSIQQKKDGWIVKNTRSCYFALFPLDHTHDKI